MSAFALKIVAIICMIFDHSSFLKNGLDMTLMRNIGRIAFPIFAFLIAEGYVHTKDLKKYYYRLIIFSLISQIPYYLFNKPYLYGLHLNVGFTLLLGLFSINIYDIVTKKYKKKKYDINLFYYSLGIILIISIAFLASYFKCDYGYYGVLLILFFYIFRKNKIALNIAIISLMIFKYYGYILNGFFDYDIVITILFTLSSMIFINLYNGKEGYKMKWFFYIVYPLHLLILSIIDMYV